MNLVGVVGLVVAAAASAALAVRPADRRVAAATIVAWWSTLAWLMNRFAMSDLSLDLVDRFSRSTAPAWLRWSATWASPEGSLLLWVALLATAAISATGGPAAVGWRRGIAVASMSAAFVLLGPASPFGLADGTSAIGAGLNPVLEHPMMSIHPPVLYLAHSLAVVAALAGPQRRARRFGLAALAVFVIATMLGAWWAHDELGWGGWWAWDPVENTALAPIALLAAAAHLPGRRSDGERSANWQRAHRWRAAGLISVLVGVAVARSGLASSVHSFAPSAAPAALVATWALVVSVAVWRAERRREPVPHTPRSTRAESVIVPLVGAWIAFVVVAAEVAAAWLGTRTPPAALHGPTVGRALIPAGVALVAGVTVWGIRRRVGVGGLVAHLGVLVFAVGVVASLFDSSATASIETGSTMESAVEIDGRSVSIGEQRVTDGEAVGGDGSGQRSVDVDVMVDGRLFTPSVVQYLDLDRTRARPARRSDWRGETEVVVLYVDADRVRVEVRRHPGLGAVWVGGGLVAAGAVVSALRWRRGRSEHFG